MNISKTTISLAMTAALGVTGALVATENPFGMQTLDSGYLQLADAKAGEGKCGANKKAEEGKCGGDKATDAKHDENKKIGEAKCGADKQEASKAKDGKCGEGKCGADKK